METDTTPDGAVSDSTSAATGGEVSTAETLLSATVDAGADTSGNQNSNSDNPFAALIGPDGAFVDGWPNLLKGAEYDEVRATAQNYKTLPALLKGLKDSKAAAMAKTEGMVKLPGAEAKPEEIAAFRSALGIPEAPEGYQLKPEALPPGVEIDPEVFADFAKVAHASNLTPAQVETLAAWQANLELKSAEKATAEHAAYLAAQKQELQTKWGPKAPEKMMQAQRAAATFGLKPENPIFQSAEVVAAFAAIADAMSEDKLVSGESLTNRLSPEAGAKDILSNTANRWHKAYHDPGHPDHRAAVDEYLRLMKEAYPG